MKRKLLGCGLASVLGSLYLSGSAFAQEADIGRVISFGDSLSDGGAYGGLVPQGGTFTTDPDEVWVSILAQGLGLTSDSYVNGGLNYAQGGSRVFEFQPPGVFSQTPIAYQIGGYLAAGGTFTQNDVVTLQGGGNDLFAFQAGQATATDVGAAAITLATLAQQIVDAGAGTLVVANIQTIDDFNTPFELQLALNNTNAFFLNVDALFQEVITNPGQFGITNITDNACGPLDSLVCTTDTMVTPDANRTYARADNVHPTGVIHEMQGNMALAGIQSAGQVSQLAYVLESALYNASALAQSNFQHRVVSEKPSLIVDVKASNVDVDRGNRGNGLSQDGVTYTLGFDHQPRENVGLGAFLSFADADGDFESTFGGSYETTSFTGTGYVRGQFRGLRIGGSITGGFGDLSSVTRNVVLGTQMRQNSGSTDASMLSGHLEAALDLLGSDSLFFGPVIGVDGNSINITAYAEDQVNSTQMAFADQGLQTSHGLIGAEFSTQGEGKIQGFVRVLYHADLSSKDRSIRVTPYDAPINWTTTAYTAGEDFVSYSAGVEMNVSNAISLSIAGSGQTDRDGIDSTSLSGHLAVRF